MLERLTNRQRMGMDHILDSIRMRGVPPTIREIADYFGFASPRTVQDHLKNLARKGYIRVKRGFYRGIDVLIPIDKIPVMERIPAASIDLETDGVEGYIDFSDIFRSQKDLFALKVYGDSMSGEGIMGGDIVVARRQPVADNGDIVLVSLNEGVACRILNVDVKGVRLEPANPRYQTIFVRKVTILGKVVGLLRNYEESVVSKGEYRNTMG